jgi:hypothetical protein
VNTESEFGVHSLRRHRASVSSMVSPQFLTQMKEKYDDGAQSYVFKPVKKVIVRPYDLQRTVKPMTEGRFLFLKEQSGYPLNDSLMMTESTQNEIKVQTQMTQSYAEETYNPLKLPRYDTYQPLDKRAYLDSVRSVGSKVGSFRKQSKTEKARQRKFIREEDKKFEDNPLYDPKAANSSAQRNNNLYKIKLRVEKTVVKAPEKQPKEE